MFCKLPPRTPEAKYNLEMIQLLQSLVPPLDHQLNDYSWNENDRSPNIYVASENKFMFHKLCEEPSTDCVRGKCAFESGVHAWEITWAPSHRGLYPVVGVATAEAPLHEMGEKILVGNSKTSWGWDLNSNLLHHNSSDGTGRKYPEFMKDDAKILVPEKITILLNMEDGTLAYILNKFYLGVAFKDLKGLKLFPIVNVTQHGAQITMKYLGGLTSEEKKNIDG